MINCADGGTRSQDAHVVSSGSDKCCLSEDLFAMFVNPPLLVDMYYLSKTVPGLSQSTAYKTCKHHSLTTHFYQRYNKPGASLTDTGACFNVIL